MFFSGVCMWACGIHFAKIYFVYIDFVLEALNIYGVNAYIKAACVCMQMDAFVMAFYHYSTGPHTLTHIRIYAMHMCSAFHVYVGKHAIISIQFYQLPHSEHHFWVSCIPLHFQLNWISDCARIDDSYKIKILCEMVKCIRETEPMDNETKKK